MMRAIHWTLAALAGVLGVGHMTLGFLAEGDWSLGKHWFIGAGLAMAATAVANAISLRAGDRSSPLALLILNGLLAAYFATALPMLFAPQVIVGLIAFAGMAGLTALSVLKPQSVR